MLLLSATNLSGTGIPPHGQSSPDATLLLQQTYVSTCFPSPREEDFALMKKGKKQKRLAFVLQ